MSVAVDPVVAAALRLVDSSPERARRPDCPRCTTGHRARGRRLCDTCRDDAERDSRHRWWDTNGSKWRRGRRLEAA